MGKFFYTYVLDCIDSENSHKHYVGYTSDLRKRLQRHNAKNVYTTSKYLKIELIYYEACKDRESAISREKALKTGFGRRYLKNRLKLET